MKIFEWLKYAFVLAGAYSITKNIVDYSTLSSDHKQNALASADALVKEDSLMYLFNNPQLLYGIAILGLFAMTFLTIRSLRYDWGKGELLKTIKSATSASLINSSLLHALMFFGIMYLLPMTPKLVKDLLIQDRFTPVPIGLSDYGTLMTAKASIMLLLAVAALILCVNLYRSAVKKLIEEEKIYERQVKAEISTKSVLITGLLMFGPITVLAPSMEYYNNVIKAEQRIADKESFTYYDVKGYLHVVQKGVEVYNGGYKILAISMGDDIKTVALLDNGKAVILQTAELMDVVQVTDEEIEQMKSEAKKAAE